MKWRPFHVFPPELWKVKRAEILSEKWPINGELITIITRLKKGFKVSNIPNFVCRAFWVKPSLLCSLQSVPCWEVIGERGRGGGEVERQLGDVRVVCGWFVHFPYNSVVLICASETSKQHSIVSLT